MFRTITPILSIILAIFVYFFFVQARLEQISTLQAEEQVFQTVLKQAEERNNLLNALNAKMNSMTSDQRDRLSAFLPYEVDEVKLLVDLNEMAKSHNMLIGNISVEQGDLGGARVAAEAGNEFQNVRMENFATSDISFGLIGTYDQFKAMLSDMERSLVLMEVISLSFSAGEGNLQQFDVVVRAYSLPEVN